MVPLPRGTSTILRINPNPSSKPLLRSAVGFCALIALFAAFPGAAQVITIDTSGKGPVAKGPGSPVARRASCSSASCSRSRALPCARFRAATRALRW